MWLPMRSRSPALHALSHHPEQSSAPLIQASVLRSHAMDIGLASFGSQHLAGRREEQVHVARFGSLPHVFPQSMPMLSQRDRNEMAFLYDAAMLRSSLLEHLAKEPHARQSLSDLSQLLARADYGPNPKKKHAGTTLNTPRQPQLVLYRFHSHPQQFPNPSSASMFPDPDRRTPCPLFPTSPHFSPLLPTSPHFSTLLHTSPHLSPLVALLHPEQDRSHFSALNPFVLCTSLQPPKIQAGARHVGPRTGAPSVQEAHREA